jgi:cyclic beta-1,2-glucan synthetase
MNETVSKLEATLATVDKLEKQKGHLYNWYDTKTLLPLHPKYISSVDSGNLAGHLITVSSACKAYAEAPFAHLQAGLDGISDVVEIVLDELKAVPDDRRIIRPLRRKLEKLTTSFQQMMIAIANEPELASIRANDLEAMAADIEILTSELDYEIGSEQSHSLLAWAKILKQTCKISIEDSKFNKSGVEILKNRLEKLTILSRTLAFKMDFAFLMREDRRLLAIGYRPEEGKLDESCYDLLASEARLTSLFGIAKGDLPTEHWFRLGRTVMHVGMRGALMSWSGSMFEYLMPPLIMQEQNGSILNQSNKLAVKRQIKYGKSRKIPWGISESAFNARDREMNYQYTGFGVPSLGMKRGLSNNKVVAPYATLLASQYQPRAAVKNLRKLEDLGARGSYGFYDAIDFTPSHLPEDINCVLVKAYMAHHQGMSILAVSNVIFQGRLRERFHRDPVIEAVELLLQEKAPREVPILAAKMGASEPISGRSELPNIATRIIVDPIASDRSIALLSDGHYSLMLNATGSGYASWNGLAVTRWQPDQVEDEWGNFLFLRDIETNEWWSATASPRQAPNEIAQTVFSDSKAEFHKTVGTLRSQVDAIVAMESDAEGRQITLENRGVKDRFIEVTSYCEPVISSSDADNAHPAFSKMFIKTEIANSGSVIYAERNKRQPGEPDMQIAHMVTESAQSERTTQAETDRRKFIGRGRKLSNAAAFDVGATLSGTDGFTLDPILSLRRTVRVPVGKKVKLIFWTIAAPSRVEVEEAVARYIHQESFEREAMHAWTRSQVQLRYIGATPEEAAVFQRLARYLIYPESGLNRAANVADISSQSKLWELGISGDCPMLVLRIDAEADIQIVRKALRAQEYYRSRGLHVDFIIINEQSTSYVQDLQNTIEIHCENARRRGVAGDVSEHIFSVRRDLMSKETYNALLSAAWVTLHARNGKFSTQIKRAERLTKSITETGSAKQKQPVPFRKNTQAVARDDSVSKVKSDDLEFWNGFGGFDTNNREYVIRLIDGQSTPQPWINVISNKNFGFHISAEGAGFTWSVNSRDYQLTPWSNDPVINRPGEAFFIVDRNTQQVFSPLRALDATASSGFEVRHGLGYSRFLRKGKNLDIELMQTVHATDPVKFSRLRVINKGALPRTFRIYGYVEWVLGNSRTKTAPFIVTNYDSENGVLTANNGYSIAFPERTAFFACDRGISSVTASRQEFLGKGNIWRPDAVFSSGNMSNATATNGDPCAAIACDLVVEAGQESDILFLLGDCASHETSSQLAKRHLPTGLDDPLQETSTYWDGILNTLQIETPDPAMDLMVNTWLPYQSIACRIRARSAFYQASGAFGFRDQLQDTLAYLMHDPELAREQILNAAGRQFPEGDVQHWWLPATGAGVRTVISDDVVWLAYGVSHYINVTGDDSILDVNLPFLEGASLEPGQHDAFLQPKTSKKKASIYTHCTLALDLAIQRTGAHGLPLFLGGDWNDGMNRVGEQGRGESVWLGWFLATVLKEFIPLAKKRGDLDHAKPWRAHQLNLQKALESAGWDGKYYRRGYFDDGSPLGSVNSDECKIDSISQSWSVLSGLGDPKKTQQAMASVVDQLIDKEAELIKLFTPPFQKTDKEPGYIKGYPPGVRENGGQYTHAATWVVYALAELGQADEAYDCFKKLNPINHSLDEKSAEIYRVEPYVVAADVYSEGELKGRGGWSWYTGASGWLYRTAVEAILGFRKKGDRLLVNPSLPNTWDGYSATLTLASVTYKIKVLKISKRSYKVTINSKEIKDAKKGYLLKQKKRQRKTPSTKSSN